MISTILALLSMAYIFVILNNGWHSTAFDATLWKTADLSAEVNWTLRWDMMNDLRKTHQLIGMTKSEVIGLLGEGYSDGNGSFDTLHYSLGMARSGIDSGILTLVFDKQKVIKIRVHRS